MKQSWLSFRHLFEGADGKLSLKRVMASGAFIMFLWLCPRLANENPELIITTLAGLIVSLLGIAAYATMQQDKLRQPPLPPPTE